jgi:hypothetical protein
MKRATIKSFYNMHHIRDILSTGGSTLIGWKPP